MPPSTTYDNQTDHNKIVDITCVGFIQTFLPQFLMDGLTDVLLFKVGHIFNSLGMIDTRVWDYCWHLQVGEVLRCLGHDGWLSDINAGNDKVLLQFLHCPGKLSQGSRSKTKDVALQITAPYLEVVIDFDLRTLGLGTCLFYLYNPWDLMHVSYFFQFSPLTNSLQGVRMVYF